MKEAVFNTEVVRSIRALGGFAHKLGDSVRSEQTRFIGEKPCDIIAGVFGKFVGIESKQFKEMKGFSIRLLRDNQIEALSEMVRTGNRAFVFLNVRLNIAGSRPESRLYYWDFAKWDRQSIGVKVLRTLPFIKGHKGIYDLTELFRDIAGGDAHHKPGSSEMTGVA